MSIGQAKAALVVHPYPANSPKGTIIGLQLAQNLDVDRIFLVHDELGPGTPYVQPAVAAVGGGGPPISLIPVRAAETGLRWIRGFEKALFEPPFADSVTLVPGDYHQEATDAHKLGLAEMVAASGPDRLVVGDYSTTDIFKDQFDSLTLPVLDETFLPLAARVRQLGCSKLRTEFLSVGRNVMERFSRVSSFRPGPDPTPQLILSALSNGFEVVRVDVAEFKDEPGERGSLGQLYQQARLALGLTVDRITFDRDHAPWRGLTRAESEVRYDELVAMIDRVSRLLQQALASNRTGRSAP